MKTKVSFSIMVAMLFLTACGNTATAQSNDGSLESRVEAIQKTSKDYFGIDINSIALLLDAPPGTVYPTDSVSFQERKKALKDLEKAGYVTVEESPDFFSVEWTEKGKALAESIQGGGK